MKTTEVGPDRFDPETWMSTAEAKAGLVVAALVLGLAAELFSFLLNSSMRVPISSYSRYINMCESPFGPDSAALPIDPQYRTRVLGPALAYALGLHGPAATVIPLLAGPLVYTLAYLAMRKQGVPPGLSCLMVLLLATTLVTMSSRMNLGIGD